MKAGEVTKLLNFMMLMTMTYLMKKRNLVLVSLLSESPENFVIDYI